MARVWTCDACGKQQPWGGDWTWFGSIGHVETCPDDLVTTCSEPCRIIAEAKLKSGEWKLPVLSADCSRIIRERKGY